MNAEPTRKLAIVTCMDARIDLARAFGLETGEAHVLRNAGGVITDDVIRSLAISQRRLGTREVMLIHHTRCGMEGLDEEELQAEVRADGDEGLRGPIGSFADVEQDLRESVLKVRDALALPNREAVRGFVYDVDTHRLREVEVDATPA